MCSVSKGPIAALMRAFERPNISLMFFLKGPDVDILRSFRGPSIMDQCINSLSVINDFINH